MKLSTALENNLKIFNNCKSSMDVLQKVNWIINHNRIEDIANSNILQKCLKKSKNFQASMVYINSFILTVERVSQKTVEKKILV